MDLDEFEQRMSEILKDEIVKKDQNDYKKFKLFALLLKDIFDSLEDILHQIDHIRRNL